MDENGKVVVIGAASIDMRGWPEAQPIRGSSVPGEIHTNFGGVARNIAENLSRLEIDTQLITAVGDDSAGEQILAHATAAGIDVSKSLIIESGRSGSYMAILEKGGMLKTAIDDMEILHNITPEYLDQNYQVFENARAVVLDANLTEKTIETIIWMCSEYHVPLVADPTTAVLAEKLRPHLSHFRMIMPNYREAGVLCGMDIDPTDRDTAILAAVKLVSAGVRRAIITLSEFGVVYADSETKGHIPAIKTHVVDQTGASDAQSAAIIFGLLQGIPLDECVRLGVTAATLTLRTRETVRADLTVELLYDELVI